MNTEFLSYTEILKSIIISHPMKKCLINSGYGRFQSLTNMRINKIPRQQFKILFKVGDVVEAHSTDKLYLITAIGHKRWLGMDSRGEEAVRTIIGNNEWRIPEKSRAESFKIHMKQNYLKGMR